MSKMQDGITPET